MADNIYDPKKESLDNDTKSMDVVVMRAVNQLLYDLHTCMPGKIVKVKGSGRIDVQPSLKRKFSDNNVVALPVIQDVFVSHPAGQDYWIKCPIAVGDEGWLFFAERSLDVWSVEGGLVDPQDTRRHHLGDCIFVPGAIPFSKQLTGAATDLVMHNGNSEIILKKDGKFQVKNAQNELIDLLSQLINVLATQAFTNTMLGPQPFIASTVQLLQQIKTKLDTMKV